MHQHFKLVLPLTVHENLLLGMSGPLWLDRRRAGRVAALAREHGLAVDPMAPVWQLSMGERQRVELLRLIVRDARVLILDEPASVLAPQESQGLFGTLRSLARSGRTVIFISHKLEEVVRAADRITVMRGGEMLAMDGAVVPGDRRPFAVRGVTLAVHAGEILGIAGIAGNGQRELAEALAGLRPIASGTVRLAGRRCGRGSGPSSP